MSDHQAPTLLFLGTVEAQAMQGPVEPSKRARLLEYAVYLALHPGASHTAIDDAIWPDRPAGVNWNTRNTATSKLRSWLGRSPDGEEWLPRHQGSGYALHPAVRTDWAAWMELLPAGARPASTPQLQQALRLIRGRPFDGVHPRRYGWADSIRQRMSAEIVEASYELGARAMREGDWPAAEAAVVTGLAIEPGMERLWRLRIVAARAAGDGHAEREAVARMLAITERLGDREPATERLLGQLRTGGRTLPRDIVLPGEPALVGKVAR